MQEEVKTPAEEQLALGDHNVASLICQSALSNIEVAFLIDSGLTTLRRLGNTGEKKWPSPGLRPTQPGTRWGRKGSGSPTALTGCQTLVILLQCVI